MTYRRLFLWILAGSTLAVVGLWSWSCWGWTELWARHSPRPGAYHAGLWSGTVILELDSGEVRPTQAAADAVPFFHHLSLPGLRGHDWSYRWTPSSDLSARHYTFRRTGEFGVEKTFHPFVIGHGFPSHYTAAYRVEFPLWVPWLLIVGGAFAGMRWLERRAAKASIMGQSPRDRIVPAPYGTAGGSASPGVHVAWRRAVGPELMPGS